MNNFENHLREHKDDYHLAEVNPAVWDRIKASGIRKSKPAFLRMKTWQIAAAVLALLATTFLLWPTSPTPDLSADLLLEYGFESQQPQLVAQSIANELSAMPVPPQYKEDHLTVLAALEALDLRYAPVLAELEKKGATEFTERQAISYYRRKVDLMSQLIKELSTLKNNEKYYSKNNTDSPLPI